jgi:DNA gyrase/topoisomerase IV subunit A
VKRVGLALIVLTFALDCFAQSVADIARKERQRQQTAKSKVVVIGSGTRATIEPTPAAKPSPASGTNSAPKSTGVTDNKGRDEKYWRTTFQNARDDLKRAEARAEILDLRVKGLNTQLLQRTDIYNRENRLGPEITSTQKELEDARKEAEQAKKKLTDLEDELRRSGGPAGWAR